MSAQVELARNYQFSCPEVSSQGVQDLSNPNQLPNCQTLWHMSTGPISQAWQVEKVSRTDADAYGTDYRVSGREGTIDVSIYPFSVITLAC